MLDYDEEAAAYDATRGGEPRAEAAADAVLGLIPAGTGRLLDVGCGTGTVTRRLAATLPAAPGDGRRSDVRHGPGGRRPVLPGSVVLADGRRPPFPDGTFDAVTSVWLLHLLDGPQDVRAVVAECARALRPGGVYVTTVDKAAAHDVGSDIDAVLAERPRRPARDAGQLGEAYAATLRNTALRIYSTPYETGTRIRTLLHDTQYRTALAWQNTYNQPPHPSFFIGDGMATAPRPKVYTP